MKIKLLKDYCGHFAGEIGTLHSYPPEIKHGISYISFDYNQTIAVRKVDLNDVYEILLNDAGENHG